MLVYGDHERGCPTSDLIHAIVADAAAIGDVRAGIERHGALVALFIRLAGLWQGMADAALHDAGADEGGLAQDAIADLAVTLARAIDRSWSSRFVDQAVPDLAVLHDIALPAAVTVREVEGYAFYALYPEQYLEAAQSVPVGAVVIGLRSIGAGLAALVATVCDAALLATVRPVGPPFNRTLSVGPALSCAIERLRDRPFVLVDEGPGLSGSSFGGAADWLEAHGVPRAAIHFLPSHDGDLGSEASDRHRARWRTAPRHVASFEDVILAGPVPLVEWFRDVTGPLLAPPQDIGGGRWRAPSPWPDAPADPAREVRKYRIEAERGSFVLRFAGLGEGGVAKFARARTLSAAGFVPEPLALRHGFLLERWMDGVAANHADVLAMLPRYLSYRAEHFADAPAGAALPALLAMARRNLGAAGGPLIEGWTEARVATLAERVRPVHVDARLHRWEWLATAAGVVKTDALDHSQAHDLIGCQDVAWDVAGAAVEFAFSADEHAALTAAVMPGRDEAEDLVAFCTIAYAAFQIGWWSYAPAHEGAAQVMRYHRALRCPCVK